jgi:membrane peptidoglycan carboxypeptidase
MKRKKKIVKRVFWLFVFGVSLCAVGFAYAFFYFSSTLPSVEEISSHRVDQSTKIYDRTGSTLLYEVSAGEQRTVIPLEDIPQYLKDATIVVEDEGFYTEPAFDWKGIVRAVYVNLMRGQVLQGGSTITQQLARNAFLTPEQTITRKIKELILATRIDRLYSKDKILELYFNQIPYGPTFYGIEAASRGFFNKPASELTLAQSALLAAIPKAPTYYSPWGSHTKELMTRQKFILEKMQAHGKITKKEMDAALSEKITFQPNSHGIKAPHFVMAVTDYLAAKYGEDLVQKGGLRVVTTLNWDLEQAAEKAVADGAAQNEELYQGLNAALVAEDPTTGQILAMVGSRNYFATSSLPAGCTPSVNCGFEPNFNVATQGLRQPGSALKPFVYLTAFEKGYTPDTVLFDVPTEFAANNPNCPPIPDFTNENTACFHPENFDGVFRGPVPLRTALAQSINIPAVKTLYLAGLKDSVKNAYNFGLTTLTSPDLYGLSLVLGGGAVHLIDLVGAYSVLSQEGAKHAQSFILEVKDANGTVLESFKDNAQQVADPQPVRLINNILSDTDARSGLFQNSLGLTVFPDHDVALKTGTSNDYRDAWAMGYTPSLVVGVWAGNNNNAKMQRHGSSILAAVPIWSTFMKEALVNMPEETFNRPDPVPAAKPVLGGDYLHDKQVHSILYYVDRADPTGPPPVNPADDPQFVNWETGVLAWAQKNILDYSAYNQPVVPGAQENPISIAPPQVEITSPAAGTFVSGQLAIAAKISGTNLLKAKVYWNGTNIQEFGLGSSESYDLRFAVAPPNIAPQNLLEIEVITNDNQSVKSGVIVYGQ